jgi:hypothetical protein
MRMQTFDGEMSDGTQISKNALDQRKQLKGANTNLWKGTYFSTDSIFTFNFVSARDRWLGNE